MNYLISCLSMIKNFLRYFEVIHIFSYCTLEKRLTYSHQANYTRLPLLIGILWLNVPCCLLSYRIVILTYISSVLGTSEKKWISISQFVESIISLPLTFSLCHFLSLFYSLSFYFALQKKWIFKISLSLSFPWQHKTAIKTNLFLFSLSFMAISNMGAVTPSEAAVISYLQ